MKNNRKGMGFCSTLTLIFVVLKVIGAINWGWSAVLLPLLIAATFKLLAILIAVCRMKRYWRVRK